MKAPTMDEWAEKLGTKALNGFVYEGKTLREWIDLMASGYCVVLPDGATNGDVIKAVFPNAKIDEIERFKDYPETRVSWEGLIAMCPTFWWNEPYKAGDEDGNS